MTPDDVRVHLSEMLAGSIPAAATIHWRERDAARRGKTVKTASVDVSQKAYYIIEEPDTSGSFGHIVHR